MNFQPPAGYELMAPEVQERARRNYASRAQQEERVTSIGPRKLTPGDGIRQPSSWDDVIKPRQWIVPGLIPAAQVTMITGNGGEGKSLISAQLTVAADIGIQWLGHNVNRVRSVYVHCEDDEDEMKRRIHGIVTPEGKDFSDLENLLLIDRDDAETSLFYEAMGNDPSGRFTEFYQRVYETVRDYGAQLLVLDSLYNFFGGNENIRSQVTEFIGGLKRMAKRLNCAVVIVAHPGRAGMGQGGDGTSGSTAWHNAVRSRFYLHRKKHPSGDPEKQGPLVFEHMKANYGGKVAAAELFWDRGRFMPTVDVDAGPAFDRTMFGDRS